MKKINLKFLAILSILLGVILYSCSSGGSRDLTPEPLPFYGCTDSTALNYDSLASVDDSSCIYPPEPFNIASLSGDWLFDSECNEYVLGLDTIYLDQQLPDTITINSDTDSTIFIDAGSNNLVANVDLNGNFIIPNQTFLADVDLGFGLTTLPIYLTGDGIFSSYSSATMNLTFSEPNLPGQIDCIVSLSKLD